MIILLDVGGTEIKGAAFLETGQHLTEIIHFPAKAKSGREDILSNFAEIISSFIKSGGETIHSIGMAFPGPFDYEKGICLMQGLDKYDAIYGVSLEQELKERIQELKGAAFAFCHDIEAFALGVSELKELSGFDRIFYLCIGTGAGSAFTGEGRILKEGQGVPESGWIYKQPFRESIIDDYLSVRGLQKIAETVFEQECFEAQAGMESQGGMEVQAQMESPGGMEVQDGIKLPDGARLYQLAKEGDGRALDVWTDFGATVNEALHPILEAFSPEAIVFGGQIAKSFCYFGEKIKESCEQMGIAIHLEYDTSIRAIQGLNRICQTRKKQEEL